MRIKSLAAGLLMCFAASTANANWWVLYEDVPWQSGLLGNFLNGIMCFVGGAGPNYVPTTYTPVHGGPFNGFAGWYKVHHGGCGG